jgi:tetratricopeptide (TPR) repeat protein
MKLAIDPGKENAVWLRNPVFVLILVLVLAGALILGTIFYLSQAASHFSALVQQGKYAEAASYYQRADGSLPGFIKEHAEARFQHRLESEIDRMTRNFLSHQIDYDTVQQSFDSMAKIGLNPTNLAKCRVIVTAENISNLSDPHQALAIVTQELKSYPGDSTLTAELKEIQTKVNQLVLYQGPVQHIFFHPLIVYPELAFDNDRMSEGLNEYFVTVKEFNRMIASLYKNNYILIDIHSIYETATVNGKLTVKSKQLWLPRGKKPLILSIDDMNYYYYMIEDGMVYKLIIDDHGNVATYSKDLTGKEVISRDNEIVPILDQFVSKHPDFSYRGAKGVINLTGYQGVLGYRTNELDSPADAKEKEGALAVIKRLKETGWSFACHGYGHLNTPAISLDRLVQDTQRWQAEVEPLVGPTDIYVFPFGAKVLPGDPKFQYLQQAGFNVFCSVGPREYLKYGTNYVFMDRRHMDGIALLQQPQTLTDLFDPGQVVDPIRPPLP